MFHEVLHSKVNSPDVRRSIISYYLSSSIMCISNEKFAGKNINTSILFNLQLIVKLCRALTFKCKLVFKKYYKHDILLKLVYSEKCI